MAKRRLISEDEFKEAIEFARAFISSNYLGVGLLSKDTENLWDDLSMRDRLADDPVKAIEAAKSNFRLQLAFRREIVKGLQNGSEFPAEVIAWLVQILLGEEKFIGPRVKQKNGIIDFVIWETLKRLDARGLHPTRAPSTSPRHSGADAIAEALVEVEGIPSTSFDAVVHIYRRYSQLDAQNK